MADRSVEAPRSLPAGETPRPAIPVHQELIDRLGWFVGLRWLAVAGLTATILITRFILRIPVPVGILLGITCAIFAYNLAFFLLHKGMVRAARIRWRTAERFAMAQILLDLVALALLIHFSGGIENPFIFYFIFHVILASILLSRRAVLEVAAFAVILLAFVAYLEYAGIVRHWPLEGFVPATVHTNGEYISAVLFVFATTLLLAMYMTSEVARRLRDREADLLNTREALSAKSRSLGEALRRIQELQQHRARFLRVSAHQLRGPLATIKTCVRSIADGHFGPVTEKQAWLLRGTELKSLELLAIIRDLLNLAYLREVDREEARKEVDLAVLSQKILSEVAERAREKGVRIEADIEPADLSLAGFERGLRDMLTNLLENAVKYSPDGGAVAYRLRREGETVVGEVQDRGIGIPEAFLDEIFEEFVRAPNAKKAIGEGTGLGLSIVKSVLDAHGGRIEVESREGEGATFTFRLPCRRRKEGPPA